ncbi:MAG: metallophosphoesterase, partial [Candidatus Thermoplasmatota archaeon]|nr:metallophosphoesterase [Candidatus Thermoplasmatota archaeon]
MKRNTIISIIGLLVILCLLSSYIPLSAEQQKIKDTPLTFSTYTEYYHIFDENDPLLIYHPLSSIPVILTPEQSFIIQFRSIPYDSLTATITTAYTILPDIIPIPIESITQEQDILYATASIPIDTPPELYNITLTIQTDGETYTTTQPRSVSVKQSISDSFTFIHLTDFHIGDPRGLVENPKETIGWKAARKVIEEVNLLQPDFVLISGDLTFGQLYPFEYTVEYKKCYEILQEFTVPTFLCPGNHDGYFQLGQDGLRFWEQTFGPLYYSFDYGDTHFLSINSYDWSRRDRIGFSYLVFNWGGSIREEQMIWIEDDLSKNSDTEQTLMMMHHNPLWDTKTDSLLRKGYHGREEILTLIRTKGVDGVFAGHVHYDDVTIDNDTTYITTTTLSSSLSRDGYWGYRMITVEDSMLTAYNYKEPKYSIPSYNINILDSTDQSITISNDLEQPISVLVDFIVPNDEYT